MKLSEQWLREWIDPFVPIDQLSTQLTMLGLEVESISPAANDFSGVYIGQVLSAEQHPDADRLRVCTVKISHDDVPLTIVCGAANVRAGLTVAVATIGAVLAENFIIKKSKLRGIVSEGMICSANELGLAEKSEGILELPEDAPLGNDFRDWLKLNDSILEIKLTPNRGDCLSLLGIAREVSVASDLPLSLPIYPKIPAQSTLTFPVEIKASQQCPHYVGRVISNINANAKTPIWMQERLRRSGVRSISAVVDVTNYVLLELGQPLHAFDLEKLDQHLCVRMADAGETLHLLNDQTVILDPQTLVIADAKKVLAIAGVMGGLDSAVTSNTQHIFLESAYFDASSLAGCARRYSLQTDSAYRFERGVDPQLQCRAIERATQLLLDIVGGEVGELIEKIEPAHLPPPRSIILRYSRIQKILGLTVSPMSVETKLLQLGMRLSWRVAHEAWEVSIPSYRFDLNLEIDLIEEIARLYGYQRIPSASLSIQPILRKQPEHRLSLTRIRHALVDYGYQEAISYSFVEPNLQRLLDPEKLGLSLLNPIAPELSVMRTQLWSGLLTAVFYNQRRQQERIRLFETGLCFIPHETGLQQIPRLGAVVTGSADPEQWGSGKREVDFFDLKRDVVALLALSKRDKPVLFQKSEHPALHPGQSSQLVYEGRIVGHLGKLHPALAQQYHVNHPTYLFEIDLDVLLDGSLPRYQPLSKFPSIRRDLSILVDNTVSADDLLSVVRAAAGEWLVALNLFDVYQGKGILPTQRSVAMALILQHPSRTFVDQEIAELMEKVVNALKEAYSVILRD